MIDNLQSTAAQVGSINVTIQVGTWGQEITLIDYYLFPATGLSKD